METTFLITFSSLSVSLRTTEVMQAHLLALVRVRRGKAEEKKFSEA